MKDPLPIPLTEELILLMLNEQSGYLEMVPGWDLACVMGGAVVADLAIAGKIDTDLEALHVVDAIPTGDALLDPTLAEIAQAEGNFTAQYWIERSTVRSDAIVTLALKRLVERGVLDYETGGFWVLSRTVSRSGTYPSADDSMRQEAKTRILQTILQDVIPDPRDAILIGLMHTCDGFKLLLSPEDYQDCLGRIEAIVKMDAVGRSVFAAVKDSAFKPKTRRTLPTKPIPKLRYTDLLRHRDLLRGYVSKTLCQIYEVHGPVVEVPFRMGGERVVTLLGPDTNRWVNKEGRFYLRSKDHMEGLERVFGAMRTMPSMDGPEHHKIRKSLREPYSRGTLARRLPELIDHCRNGIGAWKKGDVFGATQTFQNYVSSQVSHLMIGVECSHYAEAIIKYEHRALITQVVRTLPRFMLSTPKMRRARRYLGVLSDAIHASHTPAQREGKPLDLADAMLELHQNDPMLLPDTDMLFAFVGSMVASIYLGSSLSFAVYAMARNPDLYARVRQEAEALFGNGRDPKPEDFNTETMDVTHRLFLESERLYPVIPWQYRTVMNQCVVEGFELPPKTRLLIGQTAMHYSDRFFKEPLKFDVDRFLPDRQEDTNPHVYAPYGLGTHTCLGHRWVELQIAVNLLLIAYHVSLEVTPQSYQLGINPFPTCAPNKKLKFRVTEVRNPS